MSKKLMVGTLLGMGLLFCSWSAVAADNLFKSYAYGAPLSSFKEAKGYYDCSDEVGGVARCIDDVDFIGHKFTAALIFSGSKLVMFSLISPFDTDLHATAIGSIAKTFKLSALSDEKSLFDVVQATANAKSREDFSSKLSNYESRALSGGTLTYTFYEGVDQNKKFPNMTSQLAALPDNVRAAEVMITGEGPDAALLIRFSFPKLEANKVAEAAKKPVESF